MKKYLLIILSFISFVSFSQEIMTIREVFNYDIGDEFHFKISIFPGFDYPYPDFQKIEIIDKKNYEIMDSMLYRQVFTEYKFSYYKEPYEYYISRIDTQEIYFIKLDSSIREYDPLYNADTNKNEDTWEIFLKDTIFQDVNFQCGKVINGIEFYNSHGEFDHFIRYYGNGLGLVFSSSHNNWDGLFYYNRELIYYKKGQQHCGSVNLPTILMNYFNNSISIYPNPTHNKFLIQCDNNSDNFNINIYNLLGMLVKSVPAYPVNTWIDISKLSKGYYLLRLSNNNHDYITIKMEKQ
ncbi:MAG: T9SS type A sorting domain-containing protein [Bacteroidales bacterium]